MSLSIRSETQDPLARKEGRKKERQGGILPEGGRYSVHVSGGGKSSKITIIKHARAVQLNLPSFTAPSHQGELKKKKKLRWERLCQAREFRQASHFISLPAWGWAVLQDTAFPLLSKINSAKLSKGTDSLIHEIQGRVMFPYLRAEFRMGQFPQKVTENL